MATLFGLNEGVVRAGVFATVLVAMAALELWLPKRVALHATGRRWLTNLSIAALGAGLVRVMALASAPIVAVAAALYAERHGLGLFNALAWPPWIAVAFTLLLLDLAIYLQHVASHKLPVLWRLHRMHHADPDFDVTTAVRFHPVEIGLSMLYKAALAVALGAPPMAVVLFEIILNGCALFNHANVALPAWLDRHLRLILVTPDMHRVHHSIVKAEHDSNFGFNLALWDRLFGTYLSAPAKGHTDMTIGLTPYQSTAPTRLLWSLALPFRPADRSQRRSEDG